MRDTVFQEFWQVLSESQRWAWVQDQVLKADRYVQARYANQTLLDSGPDVVQHVLFRLLMEPVGEYAEREDDTSAERYFHRCFFLRLAAVRREATAQKRCYIGANHVELDPNNHTHGVSPSPEDELSEADHLNKAQEVLSAELKHSKLSGFTRRYAENLRAFISMTTKEIAEAMGTSEANVRAARSRTQAYIGRRRALEVGKEPQER